jgi:hypothetical protein
MGQPATLLDVVHALIKECEDLARTPGLSARTQNRLLGAVKVYKSRLQTETWPSDQMVECVTDLYWEASHVLDLAADLAPRFAGTRDLLARSKQAVKAAGFGFKHRPGDHTAEELAVD